MFLFSCEKDEPVCWVCKVDSITMIDGVIVGHLSTLTHPCDISVEDIFFYEERGSTTTKIDKLQSGYICIYNVEVQSVTNCKKK
jgi:hypothetical protein